MAIASFCAPGDIEAGGVLVTNGSDQIRSRCHTGPWPPKRYSNGYFRNIQVGEIFKFGLNGWILGVAKTLGTKWANSHHYVSREPFNSPFRDPLGFTSVKRGIRLLDPIFPPPKFNTSSLLKRYLKNNKLEDAR